MQRIILLVCFCWFQLMAYSQAKQYFIYIENPTKQWFTVKLNNQLYESVGKNYIIISQLKNGNYELHITTQTASENIFTININNADKGFSIKQIDNTEIALTNIATFATINNDEKLQLKPIETQLPTIAKVDSSKIKIDNTKIDEKPVAIVANATVEPKLKKSKFKKILEKPTAEGIDLVYVDKNNTNDTVVVFVPIITEVAKLQPVIDTSTISKTIATKANADTTTTANKITANNNCLNVATENDVANFAAQMQAILKVKDRLTTAAVLLKQKCYSTNQLKRLSNLYINDNGKFLFFKAAQKSVTDMQNFATLQNELSNPAIIEEFKAFINQL